MGRTESATGGGTWGRVPRAPGTKLLQKLLAILCPWSQTVLNAAAAFGPCAQSMSPGELTWAWVSRDFTRTPTNRVGCYMADLCLQPLWGSWAQSPHSEPIIRLSRVVQAPPGQQRPSADRVLRGLRIASGSRGQRPAQLRVDEVSPPPRLRARSQAGAAGQRGRGAGSSRAAEESAWVSG